MKRRLVQCDSAPLPTNWQSEYRDALIVQINKYGPSAQVTLRLQELSDPLTGTLQGKAYDLVCIAAYIYVADQLESRGGPTDIYGKDWRRETAISIPVGEPEFWNSSQIRKLLEQTVNFVSGEVWHFSFSKLHSPEQLSLDIDQREVKYNPDSVILFSGGADSLCATVEAVLEKGLRPVLVSHWSVPLMKTSQTELVEQLRVKIPCWQFPHSKFVVNKIQTKERDSTQRTRSFLFASLGIAVASTIQVKKVFLADNGIVSLNLPINDQLIGSLASRSTHPRFIESFNRLAEAVFQNKPQINNPLWERTKAECLEILQNNGLSELLTTTNSCAHRRNLSNAHPQCGVCSQCVDRRFASLAATMEGVDPLSRYDKDIFRDNLEGNAITMVESYLRFSRRIQRLTPEEIFEEYPQLAEALPLSDPKPDSTMQKYTSMIKRHAESVINVAEKQVHNASRELVLDTLPATCLISLAVQKSGIVKKEDKPDFEHSSDYRSIMWCGKNYVLTPRQAEIVSILHGAYRAGNPALRWDQISDRLIMSEMDTLPTKMSDVFKKSFLWGKLVIRMSRDMYKLNL